MRSRPMTFLTTALATLALLLTGAASGAGSTSAPPGTFEGTVVRTVADDFEGGDSTEEVRVVTAGASVSVPTSLSPGLNGGDRVRVAIEGAGRMSTAEAFEAAGRGSLTVTGVEVTSPMQPASQLGEHRVLVVPLYFGASAPTSPTTAELNTMIANNSTYFAATTNSKITMVKHQLAPWRKVTWKTCQEATNAMFYSDWPASVAGSLPRSPVNHIVFYAPRIADCYFAGLGSYGVGASGYPIVWLNGSIATSTLSHEIGHNMGLGHTGAASCVDSKGQEVVGLSGSCVVNAYRDNYDLMGNNPMKHYVNDLPGELAAVHHRAIGTLPASSVPSVGVGTHSLRPLTATSGVRGLTVPVTSRRTLHIEYRTEARMDDWIYAFPNEDPDKPNGPGGGVVVRLVETDANGQPGDLGTLDLQRADEPYTWPAPGGGYYYILNDAPVTLPVGTTWNVQGSSPAISITVTAQTTSSATVVIGGASRTTSVLRWAGANRYATSATIATRAYPQGASTVMLASGQDFPDALAGAPVAGARSMPVLLTAPAALPSQTRGALTTLGAQRVIILGGEAAVSSAVVESLRSMGLTVERWSGADRWQTAAAISRKAFPSGSRCLYVVSGLAFPDALSGAPAAGAGGCALLPVNGTSVPSVVRQEISRLAPSRVVFVGGQAAVSTEAATAVLAAAPGATSTRLAGGNRYETSVAIAKQDVFTRPRAEVFVASGQNFPDALSMAAVAGARKAPMLLTAPENLPSVIRTEIGRLATPRAILAGGEVSVSEPVAAAIKAVLR